MADLVWEVLNPFVKEADTGRKMEVKSTDELCAEIKATDERMALAGVRRGPFQLAGNLVVGNKVFFERAPLVNGYKKIPIMAKGRK